MSARGVSLRPPFKLLPGDGEMSDSDSSELIDQLHARLGRGACMRIACVDQHAPDVLVWIDGVQLAGRDDRLDDGEVLSVVGTRRPSFGGLDSCKRLVQELAERYPELVVVSGLAYGIDHCAHKTALDCGLKTLAVLGH